MSGDVVVGLSSPAGDSALHAFAYDLGAATPTMKDLGTLGGTYSDGRAVSGDVVVGMSSTAGNSADHAFAYDLGAATPTMKDLGTLGGTYSEADAVSGDIVVGYSSLSSGATHAFAYDLGASPPAMQDLGTLGGNYSEADAVSGDIVVGSSSLSSGALHAFAYDLGASTPTMQDLGTLGFSSTAVAVSGDIVAGSSDISSGELHAAAWILSPPPVTATTTTLASSADPSIVGAQVTYTASVTPVPDGGTIAFKDGATTITGCGSQSIDASGRATCQLTHTDVGTRSITAEYSGNAGYTASTSEPLGQDITYAIELLYDPTKASKGRSVVKVELQDAAQNNLSSSTITLTVAGLSPSPAPGTAPGGTFTFVAPRKGSSYYQFSVNTRNYPAGTYTLSFTAGADPTTHTASFVGQVAATPTEPPAEAGGSVVRPDSPRKNHSLVSRLTRNLYSTPWKSSHCPSPPSRSSRKTRSGSPIPRCRRTSSARCNTSSATSTGDRAGARRPWGSARASTKHCAASTASRYRSRRRSRSSWATSTTLGNGPCTPLGTKSARTATTLGRS